MLAEFEMRSKIDLDVSKLGLNPLRLEQSLPVLNMYRLLS